MMGSNDRLSRRTVLKSTAATAVGVGLAGCAGDDTDDGGAGGDDGGAGGDDGGADETTTTTTTDEEDAGVGGNYDAGNERY